MSTVEEIQAQIEAAQRQLRDAETDLDAAIEEADEARERQLLRRKLDWCQRERAAAMSAAKRERMERDLIDEDKAGPEMPHGAVADAHGDTEDSLLPDCKLSMGKEEVTCSTAIVKGEYTWRIEGFSWLVNTLEQNGDTHLECKRYFQVGKESFDFHYCPCGGCRGTLSINHCEDHGVTFRYRIYIKRRGGDFVQWGDVGNVCQPQKQYFYAFGPDVPDDGGAYPQGIFGMGHEELLKSEWVEDDTLTVKFEIELRKSAPIENVKPCIHIPSSSISADLSSLFESAKGSDVTFIVEGESIQAHAPILSARSEVFDKLLYGGMRESVTREVRIDDCDAATFRELIRFIYTDDFSCIAKVVERPSRNDAHGDCIPTLQCLLAGSHKYALARLQLWCEAQLCQRITVDSACSILRQACLYDAKQLSKACLSFIQQHYKAVAVTEQFGALAVEWPDVMLKIHFFIGQVREEYAAPAIDAVRRTMLGKRKHGQD